MNTGRIIQVIGSVFDVEFFGEELPEIYNALKVVGQFNGKDFELIGEVQQHLGGGRIRAIALGSTLGLRRGMEVVDTGDALQVPVGKETLGRVFNVLGEPVDGRGAVKAGGFIVIRRSLWNYPHSRRCSRRVSRSSICFARLSKAARPDCSGGQVWAKL